MEMMMIRRLTAAPRIYTLGPWAANLPFYHCGISCGRGSELFDVSRSYFDLPSYCGTTRDSTYLVEAQGDSMTPVIEDGDLMVVDRDREPQNGDITLACVDNGDVMAKYYKINKEAGTITLTPANKAYPERVLSKQEHKVSCLGVVRYVIRNVCAKPKLNIMKMHTLSPIGETGYGIGRNAGATGTSGSVATGVTANNTKGVRRVSPAALRAEINQNELSQLFKAQFKGAGGNPDYFTNNLMEDLVLMWTDRQIAMIANMIYEGGWLAGRPDTFTAWYRQFCMLIGRAYHDAYRPCKLIPSNALKRRFYYLKKG